MTDKTPNAKQNRMGNALSRRTFLGMSLAGGATLLAGGSATIFAGESSTAPAQATNAVWKLGGDLPVNRLGFGAMRITGDGIWGWPPIGKTRSKSCGAPLNLG